MRYGNNTLVVDFNDAMPYSHSTSFCYAPSQQAADLEKSEMMITKRNYSLQLELLGGLSSTQLLKWYQARKTHLMREEEEGKQG